MIPSNGGEKKEKMFNILMNYTAWGLIIATVDCGSMARSARGEKEEENEFKMSSLHSNQANTVGSIQKTWRQENTKILKSLSKGVISD